MTSVRTSFSELLSAPAGFPASYEQVHALSIGDRAPALTRDSVKESWEPCVLMRISKSNFAVYAADGSTTDGSVVLDEQEKTGSDCAPADDSLEQEWGLTFMEASV
eukprot:6193137-Pleurochrysis_carterae.AAC.1